VFVWEAYPSKLACILLYATRATSARILSLIDSSVLKLVQKDLLIRAGALVSVVSTVLFRLVLLLVQFAQHEIYFLSLARACYAVRACFERGLLWPAS